MSSPSKFCKLPGSSRGANALQRHSSLQSHNIKCKAAMPLNLCWKQTSCGNSPQKHCIVTAAALQGAAGHPAQLLHGKHRMLVRVSASYLSVQLVEQALHLVLCRQIGASQVENSRCIWGNLPQANCSALTPCSLLTCSAHGNTSMTHMKHIHDAHFLDYTCPKMCMASCSAGSNCVVPVGRQR